jgi:hypothetical protein
VRGRNRSKISIAFPDVDAELAALAEARGSTRIVPEHLLRRRDLDPAHEVEPAHRLHLARADVRDARVDRDVGVVVEVHRDAAAARVEQVGDVARDEAHRIGDALDRERREHGGVGAVRDREVEVCERLLARVRGDAGPRLDRAVAAAERGIALRHLFGADRHDALAHVVVDPVPLARGPGREHDVGAVALLGDEPHQRALALRVELALCVEHRHHGHREPGRGRASSTDRIAARIPAIA